MVMIVVARVLVDGEDSGDDDGDVFVVDKLPLPLVVVIVVIAGEALNNGDAVPSVGIKKRVVIIVVVAFDETFSLIAMVDLVSLDCPVVAVRWMGPVVIGLWLYRSTVVDGNVLCMTEAEASNVSVLTSIDASSSALVLEAIVEAFALAEIHVSTKEEGSSEQRLIHMTSF